MDWLLYVIDVFRHLDVHLTGWAEALGPWLYVALFLVIFCETGIVVTPFLPGDSLLFAVGALIAASEGSFSLAVMLPVLCIAAILGDAANYWIGRFVGPKVFCREDSWLLNRQHLLRTQEFYERYGGKAIVLARFVPIIRTFAPFVAGIGRMNYGKFLFYNVAGGIVWVTAFLVAGYQFGQAPVVKRNFQFVILAIILISVAPIAIEYVRARRRKSAPAAVDGK